MQAAAAGLLHLPLECVQLILDRLLESYYIPAPAQRPPDGSKVKLQEMVQLRQVHPIFDQAVMAYITKTKLLRPRIWHGVGSCRACLDCREVSWFGAAYLLRRPHAQQPWNGNISALLNGLVDAVLQKSGEPPTESIRYACLRALLKALRPPPFRSLDHGMIPWLFPEKSPITDLQFDYLVVWAAAVLGKADLVFEWLRSATRPQVEVEDQMFRSFVYAAVVGGHRKIVRRVLSKHVDINDPMHEAMETAVDNDDLAMVSLLLSPMYNHMNGGDRFERVIVRSIRLQQPDITNLLLERAGDQDLPVVSHDGLREACYNGDLKIVRRLFGRPLRTEIYLDINHFWGMGSICRPPLELAVRGGHVDLVRFLLQNGADPYGDPVCSPTPPRGWRRGPDRSSGTKTMRAAAANGNLDITRMLLEAGVELRPEQWEKVIIVAACHANSVFLRFLVHSGTIDLGVWCDEYPGVVRRTMLCFCECGATEAIKLYADEGVPLCGPFYTKSNSPFEGEPMTLALALDRAEVIETLLSMGVPLVAESYRLSVLPRHHRLTERFERDVPGRPQRPIF